MGNTWDKVVEANKAYKKGIEYYKEQVELHRKQKKFGQEFSFVLYERIKSYLANLEDDGSPITIAGIILASGVSKKTFFELKKGEYDYDLYAYMDARGLTFDDAEEYEGMPFICYEGTNVLLVPMSEIIEKVYLLQEQEVESRLYKNGRVGDIFALKAKHHWIEEEKTPHTVNQTLVIASPEEAKEAIKLLK